MRRSIEPPRSDGSRPEESLARISISLPRNLYRQIRLRALDQDTTLTALIVRLIRDELSREP